MTRLDPLRARVLGLERTVRDILDMLRELVDRVAALEDHRHDDD